MNQLQTYEGTTIQYWMTKPLWPHRWALAPPGWEGTKWSIVDQEYAAPEFGADDPLETCWKAYESLKESAEYDRKQGYRPWCADDLEMCECKLQKENDEWRKK